MRTVRFELLRPDEIIRERNRFPVVYLPVAPLEWHGPHLALGTDPLNAEAVSRLVAENTGGVVHPTLYCGTERERSPEMLKNIGFKGDEWVVGMDFPNNTMPSLYFREDVFGIIVRAHLELLVKQGYKLIVIINGHGAENHMNTLQRLAKEFTAETNSTVLSILANYSDEELAVDFGHANITETSILKYLYPESVDLSTLPPKGETIFNLDFAIVDDASFRGNANGDFSVSADPRDAAVELGAETLKKSIKSISRFVMETWEEISRR